MTGKNTKNRIIYLIPALLAMFIYNSFSIAGFYLVDRVGIRALKIPESVLEHQSSLIDTISTSVLFLVYLIWLKCLRDRRTSSETEKRMLPKAAMMALGFNGMASLWFVFVDTYLVKHVELIEKSVNNFTETWSDVGNENYFWVLLSVVIVGPVVEEMLFRGVVFHYLEKIRGGAFPVVFSALFFGIWHGEPVQMVYTAVIGIGLGIIYYRTRNLKMSIAAHMFNNLLSTLPPAWDTEAVNHGISMAALAMVLPTIILLSCMAAKGSRRA